MKLQIFALYDKQTATLTQPFFCNNEVEAKRAVTAQLQHDKTGMLKQYSDAFDLYQLGEVSDEALKAHIPTDEERRVNDATYRYFPDIGINDVDVSDVSKGMRKFICTVKSIVEFLEIMAKNQEVAANEEK